MLFIQCLHFSVFYFQVHLIIFRDIHRTKATIAIYYISPSINQLYGRCIMKFSLFKEALTNIFIKFHKELIPIAAKNIAA